MFELVLKVSYFYFYNPGLTSSLDAVLDLIPGVFEVSPVLNLQQRIDRQQTVELLVVEKNLQFLRDQYSHNPTRDDLEQQCLEYEFKVEHVLLTEEHKSVLEDFKKKLV